MTADHVDILNSKNNISKDLGWYPVARSIDLKKEPLRVTFCNQAYVLFQSLNKITALPDECPHRGYPLSAGKVCDGEIRCPYHGWRFNALGQLTDIPGQPCFVKREKIITQPIMAIEHASFIWIMVRDSEFSDAPHVSAAHSKSDFFTITDVIEAEAVDILENFLDPLHTHFVHPWVIRSSKSPRHGCDVLVRDCKNGYEAEYREEQRHSGILSKLFGRNITYGIGRISYPGFVEIEYHSKFGIELAVVVYLHQMDGLKHRIFIRVYYRKTATPFFLKTALMFPFQWITYRQDKKVLERLQQNRHQSFSASAADGDIMRKNIVKTLAGEFSPLEERKRLML